MTAASLTADLPITFYRDCALTALDRFQRAQVRTPLASAIIGQLQDQILALPLPLADDASQAAYLDRIDKLLLSARSRLAATILDVEGRE